MTSPASLGGGHGVLREGAAGLVHVAHDGIKAAEAHRQLVRYLLHVGSNAVTDARALPLFQRSRVQQDGLLVKVGRDPGDALGLFERPHAGGLFVYLAGAAGGHTAQLLDGAAPEDLRIDRGILVLEGNQLAGVVVKAHVGRRVGRGALHVVGPDVGGAVGQLGLFIDDEGQVGPFLHELLVVELVLDDVVPPRQSQSAVGTGAHAQPHVGLHGVGAHVRVDDHRLAAGIAQLGHAAAGLGRLRDGGLGTPQNDHLGVDVFGIALLVHVVDLIPHSHLFVVALGQALEALLNRRVGDGLVGTAVHEQGNGVARQVALRATRLEHRGRAERMGHGDGLAHGVRAATANRGEERIGAVLLDGLRDLGGGQIDGLFPRDALPGHLLGAARTRALERIQHAPRTVHVVDLVQTLHAHRAQRGGRVRMTFYFGQNPVFHVHAARAGLDARAARRHIGLARAAGALGRPCSLGLFQPPFVVRAQSHGGTAQGGGLDKGTSAQTLTRHKTPFFET